MDQYTQQQKNQFMLAALIEAKKAAKHGEIPIGCVIAAGDKIIGRGYNSRESAHDATAHAEINAIRQADQVVNDWRLTDSSLFVTLEPCPMCSGAIINARIKNIYYGCADPKAGTAGTLMNILTDKRFNHQARVEKGICKSECEKVLHSFFAKIRENH